MGSFADRVRPWDCEKCGMSRISANRQDCPKCHEPRAGSVAAQTRDAEEASGQVTREYEGAKELQQGIADMARKGWRVQSQSSYQPRAGVGRVVALGFIGAAVIKPPVKFTVVYTRA